MIKHPLPKHGGSWRREGDKLVPASHAPAKPKPAAPAPARRPSGTQHEDKK